MQQVLNDNLGRQRLTMHERGICVVIPTYNNVGTIRDVVARAKAQCDDVIVVCDGATDGTLEVLRSMEGIVLVEYPQNAGKGEALRQGFRKALSMGFAYAMYRRVDAEKRRSYRSMFLSSALAVFLTGVTEPIEFMFLFCALPLYLVYAVLQGFAFALSGVIDLRLHSFGNLEFLTRIPMSVNAGLSGDILNFLLASLAFFGIGYVVAYFMIGKFRFATPGRLGNDAAGSEPVVQQRTGTGDSQPERIIALLGGRENIVLVDACMTRLRVTVKNPDLVADIEKWRAEGALSLMKKETGIQAVYGTKADVLKSDISDLL